MSELFIARVTVTYARFKLYMCCHRTPPTQEVTAPAAPAETAAAAEVPPVSVEEPIPTGPSVVDTVGLPAGVPVPLAVPAEEEAAIPIAT